MNGLPYYKAYPRDFIEGTIGIPFEIKCAYRVIIDLIYLQGGRLPDDPRYISGNLGCSIRKWKGIREHLIQIGKLHVSGEFLTNKRADNELETVAKYQENQAENARKPRKNKGLEKPSQSQRAIYTEPEPEVKTEPIGSAKKPRRKPEVDLPEGWVPSDRNIQDAKAKGLSEKDIENEADRFRDHHYSKQSRFRDWDAAWRTWCSNANKFGRRGIMAGGPGYGNGGQRSSLASIVARRHAQGN